MRRFSLVIGITFLAASAARAGDEPTPHFPVPAAEAERRLGSEPFEIRSAKRTAGGVAGAMKMVLVFPRDGRELVVKWKTAPEGSAEGFNNSPRKEIAAYEIQKIFLEPEDYVVPPSVARCISLEQFREVEAEAKPTIPGTSCVFGAFSLWLENVRPDSHRGTVPRPTPAQGFSVDEELFANDEQYAESIGNVNILGILIQHRDGRLGNFLLSADDEDVHVFAIDNGIAFGGFVYNYLVANWDSLRVPSLPEDSIEALAALEGRDLMDLGVFGELRADANGVLQTVEPGSNLDPQTGTRIGDGVVQLGLTRNEITGMARRLNELLSHVREGAIAVD